MNRIIPYLLLAIFTIPVLNLAAQQAKASSEQKPAKKIFRPNVYLGHSEYSYGNITKGDLDNLLKQGLTSHDSTGKKYKVVSFDFTYVERNLYEDEVGNLMVTPEYLTEHCNGDTLRSIISASIYDRTKAGDTVFIDNVMVVRFQGKSNVPMPDSTAFLGKGLKLVIVK